ncbi:glycosyltransferase [Longispora albida]|uniref:glycosyltransferase n=1 Tax=Longispora albida TaxID=203523 RepID=UPI0003682CC4|nr:glycosyltransferase family A protein [Longispora albida]
MTGVTAPVPEPVARGSEAGRPLHVAQVLDVELSTRLPDLPAASGGSLAWVLARRDTEPVASALVQVPAGGMTGDELRAVLGDPAGTPGFLAGRAEALRAAPPMCVVVCTRDRPAELRRALDSLLAQEYPEFRILVVDNAPQTQATAELVRELGDERVSYLLAPLPGLSNARNAAIVAAPGEYLAFTDDDVVADRYWLAEIARAFHQHPGASVVAGAIVPAELETKPQLWFEQYGGHGKGRGYRQAVFSPATAKDQNPLYPLPPFGTGANMVFRPGALEAIGGFDAALGAGMPAAGGEDTLAFMKVLRQGGVMVYQPSALIRHYHRRDLAGLATQLRGYGTGLTAVYTSLLLGSPSVLFALVRLVPTAVRDVFGGGSLRVAGLGEDFPAELLKGNLRGMLAGPAAYLRGRRRQRRARRELSRGE